MQVSYFNADDLCREKQKSREEDQRRLRDGEISPAQLQAENGFFSALERDGAFVSKRRVHISLK